MLSHLCILTILCLGVVHCAIYFAETFDELGPKWIHSKHKGPDAGEFKLSAGKFYGDPENDKGIQTSQDAKFYQLSAKFDKPFSNEGKTLILQFSVKHEQSIDCGGGYIKLFPSTLVPEKMNGDSPYHIMFGPDICGPSNKKVHVIFTYKGKNHLIKREIKCKDDVYTHLYTLIVRPDNTYEVRIDGAHEQSGTLEEDWDMLPAKKIKDPKAKKPSDWVDKAKMDDPTDKKPEDWDKQPELIPDEKATKPEDWDDEEDGEWEAPKVNNPNYKGEWKPKQIDNPAYKGPWVHPEIDNPEYTADDKLYKYDDIGAVGFELWQVKSGTIFDNILVGDDLDEAIEFGKRTIDETRVEEKKMKEKIDEEANKKAEKEKKEKEETAKKDEGKEDEEEEEDKTEDEEDDTEKEAVKDEL